MDPDEKQRITKSMFSRFLSFLCGPPAEILTQVSFIELVSEGEEGGGGDSIGISRGISRGRGLVTSNRRLSLDVSFETDRDENQRAAFDEMQQETPRNYERAS